MAQWDNHGCNNIVTTMVVLQKLSFYYSKSEVPGSTPGSSCFSLVFIKN